MEEKRDTPTDLASSRQQLGDTDTLALSTRNTANDVVTDLRVDRVLQSEEGEEDVALAVDGVVARPNTRVRSGSAGGGGEGEGLTDGKVRKMVVVLGKVGSVTLVVLAHLRRRDAVVRDLAFHRFERLGVVREGLEEGSATGSGPVFDKKKVSAT